MHRWTAAAMMALLGAVLFAAFVLQDIRLLSKDAAGDLPWGLILRYGGAMTLGGALAGYLFSGLFGRSGIMGWCLTLISGLIVAAVAGALGSAFGLLPDALTTGFGTKQMIEIAAGLLILPLALIEEPWLAIVVGALLVITHLRSRMQRQNA